MAASDYTFRTTVNLPNLSFALDPEHRVLALGSCFAEHIGGLLATHGFDCLLNPFGILYNPVSLAAGLSRMRSGTSYQKEELVCRDGIWHTWDHHGRYAAMEIDEALERINGSLSKAHAQCQELDVLILSLGTARAYFLADRPDRIVANCHRYPANHFGRRLLQVDQISDALSTELKALRQWRPHLQVILTVSPVRHIRDGLVESQESKAALLLAAHRLCRELSFVHYFPAYELLLDDLRDYRFFARDMVHPSEEAIDYIWSSFRDSLFSEKSRELFRDMQALQARLAHRPRFPSSPEHLAFLRQSLEVAEEVQRKFANLAIEQIVVRLRDEIARHPHFQ